MRPYNVMHPHDPVDQRAPGDYHQGSDPGRGEAAINHYFRILWAVIIV
jgi:hypothetical protein